MATSSGRKGFCVCCGHPMNEHTKEKHSKCKNCKKVFEICQHGSHGSGVGSKGYRICFRPCSCGSDFYPVNARSARELQPHEYMPDHPGFRAEEGYDSFTTAEGDTMSLAETDTATSGPSTADYTAFDTIDAGSTSVGYTTTGTNYTSTGYTSAGHPAAAYTTADFTTTYNASSYDTATYAPADFATAAAYSAYIPADGVNTATMTGVEVDEYYPNMNTPGDQAQARHARQQPSRSSDDPLSAFSLPSMSMTASGPATTKATRHIRFRSQGSDDPLTADEPPALVDDLASNFAHIDIGDNNAEAGPSVVQTTPEGETGTFEAPFVTTEYKNGTVRFRDLSGTRVKTRPQDWVEISTEDGVYWLFTDQTGQQFRSWGVVSASEPQASGSMGNEPKGAGKGKAKDQKAAKGKDGKSKGKSGKK